MTAVFFVFREGYGPGLEGPGAFPFAFFGNVAILMVFSKGVIGLYGRLMKCLAILDF